MIKRDKIMNNTGWIQGEVNYYLGYDRRIKKSWVVCAASYIESHSVYFSCRDEAQEAADKMNEGE